MEIRNADGALVSKYSLRSGSQTPEEHALGFPYNSAASHTETRVIRMVGGKPSKPIPGDKYANLTPANPGDTVTINGLKPPCTQCQGAMSRAAEQTGATFVYIHNAETYTFAPGK